MAVTGAIVQVLLLATLGASLGVGPVGWSTGLVCGLGAAVAVQRGLARSGARRAGPADWVTLARAMLACSVAALVAESFVRPAARSTMVAIAAVALVLDAVDGQVARRTATATPFGARFDMEVDAFLIAVLSVEVARTLAPWVLAIGAARYAFVAAGWVWPWLTEPTPPRYWCKVVAALQGIVLTVAVADVLPRVANEVALAAALALLAESFGRDVWWLWARHHRVPSTRVTKRALAEVS
ncbi:CDP-alcohol phosphatidyltransferase family protein [Acidothermaceae bacterium B102]|nr:CDP-alcohol phosphatidyltransferase family protein [Acidothermaceae bacterium B102]